MKKIILFLVFVLIVVSGIYAQEDINVLSNIISTYPLITVIFVIAHICLTFALYKMKGGGWACFYFFLAPLVLLILFLALGGGAGGVKSNRKDHHHHFH